MLQNPPQYVGNPTDNSCQQAVVATLFVAFKKASEAGSVMFDEIDKLYGAKPNKWTSSSDAVVEEIIRQGVKVVCSADVPVTMSDVEYYGEK